MPAYMHNILMFSPLVLFLRVSVVQTREGKARCISSLRKKPMDRDHIIYGQKKNDNSRSATSPIKNQNPKRKRSLNQSKNQRETRGWPHEEPLNKST